MQSFELHIPGSPLSLALEAITINHSLEDLKVVELAYAHFSDFTLNAEDADGFSWFWWHIATVSGSQGRHLWPLVHANYPVPTPTFYIKSLWATSDTYRWDTAENHVLSSSNLDNNWIWRWHVENRATPSYRQPNLENINRMTQLRILFNCDYQPHFAWTKELCFISETLSSIKLGELQE